MESPLVKTSNKRLDPFEIFILLALLISSILSLISSSNGSVVISFALESRAWIWYSSLILASLLSLYGVYSQKLVTGLLVERLGMTWIAAIFLSYAVGLISLEGHYRITPVVITLFLMLAAASRAIQITIDIKKLVRHE
jgi:hypothetical protein